MTIRPFNPRRRSVVLCWSSKTNLNTAYFRRTRSNEVIKFDHFGDSDHSCLILNKLQFDHSSHQFLYQSWIVKTWTQKILIKSQFLFFLMITYHIASFLPTGERAPPACYSCLTLDVWFVECMCVYMYRKVIGKRRRASSLPGKHGWHPIIINIKYSCGIRSRGGVNVYRLARSYTEPHIVCA